MKHLFLAILSVSFSLLGASGTIPFEFWNKSKEPVYYSFLKEPKVLSSLAYAELKPGKWITLQVAADQEIFLALHLYPKAEKGSAIDLYRLKPAGYSGVYVMRTRHEMVAPQDGPFLGSWAQPVSKEAIRHNISADAIAFSREMVQG